jgi:uncharacterized protein (TIGR02001 family)
VKQLKYLVAAIFAGAAAAAAAEAPVGISANAALVSDYRFRGISLSDRHPALQGGIDLTSRVGLFAGAWASTIADYEGADVEVDFYAGCATNLAGLDLSVSANAYLYPGGHGVDYVEIEATAERSIGPITLGVEAALAPRQDNVGKANHYLGGSAAFEFSGTGIIAKARGGYENGFYRRKWDWEIGVSYSRSIFTASFSYVDTNRGGRNEEGRLGRGGIVASLVAQF